MGGKYITPAVSHVAPARLNEYIAPVPWRCCFCTCLTCASWTHSTTICLRRPQCPTLLPRPWTDTVRWMWVMISPSPATVTIKSMESSPLLVPIARTTQEISCIRTRCAQATGMLSLDGLKFNGAAVEIEFVITVPFFGYYSAVLKDTSFILSSILLIWGFRLLAVSCG